MIAWENAQQGRGLPDHVLRGRVTVYKDRRVFERYTAKFERFRGELSAHWSVKDMQRIESFHRSQKPRYARSVARGLNRDTISANCYFGAPLNRYKVDARETMKNFKPADVSEYEVTEAESWVIVEHKRRNGKKVTPSEDCETKENPRQHSKKGSESQRVKSKPERFWPAPDTAEGTNPHCHREKVTSRYPR